MKKIVILFFISCTFIYSETQTLLFVTDDNFHPYSYKLEDKIIGYDIDILREIEKRLDIHIKIEAYPWNRTLKLIKSGYADGGFSLFKTSEREEWSLFTDLPVHISKFNIFTKVGSEFVFTGLKDLIGKKIGINRGFSINEEFDLMKKNNDIMVIESEDSEINLKLLKNGRIDCYIGNSFNTLYYINDNNLNDFFTMLPTEIVEKNDAFIVISKSSDIPNQQKLLLDINSILLEMYSDGFINNVKNKYIGEF